MKLTTKYHIVPINDGYTYLCLNANSGYELHEKAEKLPSNLTEILFNNEQTAQIYFDEKTGKKKKWATTMCHAWFIWEKGSTTEPIIRWL